MPGGNLRVINIEVPCTVHGESMNDARNLMKQAKISAMGTYHKCMRDLKEAGYIRYIPSYNPVLGSLIYLIQQKA